MDIGTVVRIIHPKDGNYYHSYNTAVTMLRANKKVFKLKDLPDSTLYRVIEVKPDRHNARLLPLDSKYVIGKYAPHACSDTIDLDSSWVEVKCLKSTAILKSATR